MAGGSTLLYYISQVIWVSKYIEIDHLVGQSTRPEENMRHIFQHFSISTASALDCIKILDPVSFFKYILDW